MATGKWWLVRVSGDEACSVRRAAGVALAGGVVYSCGEGGEEEARCPCI